MPETYPVVETFDSIQGEGVYAGAPASFARLWGCPTPRCDFCDTPYAWDKPRHEAKEMSPGQLASELPLPHVVITGGEPFLYDLVPLLEQLCDARKVVEIETSGKLPHRLPRLSFMWWPHITLSPKAAVDYTFHPSFKRIVGAVKYVITEDFDFAKVLETNPEPKEWGVPVFFQPCWYPEQERRNAALSKTYDLLHTYPSCRLSIQLHKILKIR